MWILLAVSDNSDVVISGEVWKGLLTVVLPIERCDLTFAVDGILKLSLPAALY
jgi:predicted tellurium resistance membrane protein TerC